MGFMKPNRGRRLPLLLSLRLPLPIVPLLVLLLLLLAARPAHLLCDTGERYVSTGMWSGANTPTGAEIGSR